MYQEFAQTGKEVKMQYRFKLCKLRTAALMSAVIIASGCRSVNEPVNTSVTVITPAFLEETSPASETVSSAETSLTELPPAPETSEIAEIGKYSESAEDTDTAESTEAKITFAETEYETYEVTELSEAYTAAVISPELSPSAKHTESETRLTLQYESPPETVGTVSETKVMTASLREKNSYSALNFDEQKGFWITYLEYASIMRNKSEKSFEKSIGEYFDNIAGLGFNTVYVQVRAFGDAYYDSKLFPSGEQFDGTIGTKNSFDALKIMTDCAHERGLSIHAWVNPMRLMNTKQLEKTDSCYTIKKWYDSKEYNGKYIVKSGDKWYLNPAYEEVTDLIADGIKEIAAGYDVDGIQIDDYFYPTTDKSFDSTAYAESGTSLSLSEWRISNVNKMVKKLYKAAHSQNSSVVFGISPQGSVENNYSQLYADVKTWCAEKGYCDYILPQVYFGFKSEALPYSDVAAEWNGMVKKSDVKLVIGLAAYKIGAEDNWAGSGKREWLQSSDILSRQISTAEKLSSYGGVAIYRYDSLFNPESGVAAQVNKELENISK